MKSPETPLRAAQRSEAEAVKESTVQEFIAARNVEPDSYPLIEELALIPKDTIINGMHNFFSGLSAGRSTETILRDLRQSAERAATDEQRKMYELFLAFTEQNDAYASRHLVAVLEARSR